ncbi:MAG: hypothetical protein PW792_13975 [Acidobacteriaceae bacterium]|nr:hypothetical protein [Acidobacteriaceae bacterium]
MSPIAKLHTSARFATLALVMLAPCAVLNVTGCSSSAPTNTTPAGSLTLASSANALSVAPNATSSALTLSVTRSSGNQAAVTLSASTLPSGVTATFTQPAYGTYGTVQFFTTTTITPGLYPITITASDGTNKATQTLNLTLQEVDTVSLSASPAALTLFQAGATASTSFSVTRSYGNTNNVSVSATGLPTNLTASFTQPNAGTTGSVTFASGTGTSVPAAGTYTVTLTANDGVATGATTVAVTVGATVTVANATNTAQGISGKLQEFMTTGFQPQQYTNSFFITFPSTADLAALNGLHMRLQPTHYDLPWVANSSPAAATDWSFTLVDQTVQPVLATGDNSPVFQVAQAPNFLCDSSGNFVFNTANLALFAQYAANLVRYYNKGGFDVAGKHFQSKSSHPITWWAIFNEPNLNGLTPAQYVQLYNTLVPAMLAVDPSLKFSAMELSGYSGQAQLWMPTLVATTGLTAQVDAFSTHYYSTCKQSDTDATVFSKAAAFATDMNYIRAQLKTRFPNTPVWVTENNVNSDFQLTGNISNCNGGTFVSDTRGSSSFFTSWRPYVFSILGKAGNQALYHFLFNGDQQYGEILQTTAGKTLAYWTDYELSHLFPWDGTSATGSTILTTTSTEQTASVETLAVRNTDGSYTVMVTPIAQTTTSDNNLGGAPRTVKLDLSALGTFTSGSRIDLNGATSLTAGPTATSFTPTSTITLTFPGYGTTFLTLKP